MICSECLNKCVKWVWFRGQKICLVCQHKKIPKKNCGSNCKVPTIQDLMSKWNKN